MCYPAREFVRARGVTRRSGATDTEPSGFPERRRSCCRGASNGCSRHAPDLRWSDPTLRPGGRDHYVRKNGSGTWPNGTSWEGLNRQWETRRSSADACRIDLRTVLPATVSPPHTASAEGPDDTYRTKTEYPKICRRNATCKILVNRGEGRLLHARKMKSGICRLPPRRKCVRDVENIVLHV